MAAGGRRYYQNPSIWINTFFKFQLIVDLCWFCCVREMCSTSGRNKNCQTWIFEFYIKMPQVSNNFQKIPIARPVSPALDSVIALHRTCKIPLDNCGLVVDSIVPRRCNVSIQIGKLFCFIHFKMTSSNGIIFRVTNPLSGKSTGHRWISFRKASDAVLWCFLSSVPD